MVRYEDREITVTKEERFFIIIDPLKRKHGTPHRWTTQESTGDNQEAEGAKGKASMGQKEWMRHHRQTEHIQDCIV